MNNVCGDMIATNTKSNDIRDHEFCFNKDFIENECDDRNDCDIMNNVCGDMIAINAKSNSTHDHEFSFNIDFIENECDDRNDGEITSLSPMSNMCHENETEIDVADDKTGDPLLDYLKDVKTKQPKNLKIAHININSLRNKFDYMHNVLANGLLDILCITETKLDETFRPNLFKCTGYRCYRKDKSCNSGGMMIFIREDIPHSRLAKYEINDKSCHIECMVIHIQMKKLKFYLTCLYKNPKVPNDMFVNATSQLLNQLCADSNENVIVGDMNIDMSKEDNVLDNQICDSYGLKNIIKKPTCFKSENGTLIDPVIVSNTAKFCKPFNITCSSSDHHNIVGCVTKEMFQVKSPFKISYRSYKDFNENAFKDDVNQIPYHICELFDDVSDQYWSFNVMYQEVLNQHAPVKVRTVKGDKIPYMHSDLMKQMYKRNMLKNKYLKHKSNYTWHEYRKQRNIATKLRRKAIRSYFLRKCDNVSSPRDFWQCVKPFFSDKCKGNDASIILKHDHKIVSEPKAVSNILNDFFVDIAEGIGSTNVNIESSDLDQLIELHSFHSSIVKINQQGNNELFDFKPVSYEQMHGKLKKLKTNKSTGYDLVTPKSVKLCANELTLIMTNIVNNAFNSSTFPSDMKKSEVCPLYKKNDHMEKENYRPINIIPLFSKIFESIISDQINTHMSKIFNKRLGAYRKGYGCSQLLTWAIDNWKWSLDNNMYVGTLLMDLSKAFDAIPHDLLICKLHAYGFSLNACKLIVSYLSNRWQRVKIKDVRSDWQKTKRGIPQGSCLGPLLFNLFLNDIFLFVDQCELYNYADDNTLSACNHDINVVLEMLLNDANALTKWFRENFMKVNTDKFQFMLMQPSKRSELSTEIKIEENVIETSRNVTLLGINIDDHLNFNNHVKMLCSKANRQLRVMYRFKRLLGEKEKMTLFRAFTLSIFNFCPTAWTFCSITNIRKMEKIQERALRFVTNDDNSSYDVLLQKTKNTTLLLSRICCIVIEVFKCLNNINPDYMSEMFQIKERCYNLRDPCTLTQPKFKTVMYGKQTFSYYGSHLWNNLPPDYKKCMSFKMFKNMLSRWEGPKCLCNMCSLNVLS